MGRRRRSIGSVFRKAVSRVTTFAKQGLALATTFAKQGLDLIEKQRKMINNEMRNIQTQITKNNNTIVRLNKELANLKQQESVLLSSVNKKNLPDLNAGIESIRNKITNTLTAITEQRNNNDILSTNITELQHTIDDQLIQINALNEAIESSKIEIGSLQHSIGVSSTHVTDLLNYDASIKNNIEPYVGMNDNNRLPIENDTINTIQYIYENIKVQNEYIDANVDAVKKNYHTINENTYYEEQTTDIYNYLNNVLLLIYCILYCIFIYIFISRGTVVANLDIIIVMFLFPFFMSIAITLWSYFF